METKSYTTQDRTVWGSGPWDGEPDKVQWPDVVTGLPCLAVRSHMGNWCGYVGVKEPHPLFNKPYQDTYDHDLNVHGGLTFSDSCDLGSDESEGICHVPGPGDTDRVWWFGFDCAHAWDVAPGMVEAFKNVSSRDATYRTLAYVQSQCADLALQLETMEANHVAP